MAISKITEAIEDIRNGKMIILVDDEDRENEGDLCMAAQFASAETINFMARYGRGLVCLTLSEDIADKLNLPVDRVNIILEDLEKHLTFLFRNEQGAVAWAYPVTTDTTPHHVTFSTGEQLHAA